MEPIYLDSETTGLHGPICLFQYAFGEKGEVTLYEPWFRTVNETIELFEMIANHPGGIIAFNLSFDWFHVYQMWTVLKLLQERGFGEEQLIDLINEYAELEPLGRDGPCLKPVKCHDIMLHARKGPYQSTMDRGDIRIRRVPTALAWQLAEILESRIQFDSIYFARKKDKTESNWKVFDVKNADGEIVSDFKDVVLKFHPSTALKALATDALKLQTDAVLLFRDIGVPKAYYPTEYGFAPFAKAVGSRFDWKNAWPRWIKHHATHWSSDKLAREYAAKDVIYLQRLYNHFGCPTMGDDDSELAACVACVRWRGYKIDREALIKLKEKAIQKKFKIFPDGTKFSIPTAPKQARYYIAEHLEATEAAIIGHRDVFEKFETSTKRVLLEEISKFHKDCECLASQKVIRKEVSQKMTYEEMMTSLEETEKARPKADCEICHGTGSVRHPAAIRAKEVLDARQAGTERNTYDKLLLAGRFHASFNVIGALSSRMSGTDGLNAQGIKNDNTVRACFLFAFGNLILCGGDFAGFEVTLAEAAYKDPALKRDLLTCDNCEDELDPQNNFLCRKCKSIGPCKKCKGENPKCKDCKGTNKIAYEGKAIHALFGIHVFPDMDYYQIKATKGSADDRYTRCKQAVFAMFYGGEGYTLRNRLGVDQETADKAFQKFISKYPGVGKAQKRIENLFQSMKQPGGIGTRVIWHEPADKIESMLGFPRYFTLENRICKALFDLAEDPPAEWADLKIKVLRRAEREQFVGGAVRSALFGAAFQIQSGNTRAAKNHEIQSTGAQITKAVQRKIWELQPSGVSEWCVQPCNIHDEVLCPCLPAVQEQVKEVVRLSVESFRPKVPLIKMDWKIGLNNWGEK